MEQNKLFYNICNDLWNFAKPLDKAKDKMTDEDWANAVDRMDKLTDKYKALGEKEHDLISKLTIEILNYIEKG